MTTVQIQATIDSWMSGLTGNVNNNYGSENTVACGVVPGTPKSVLNRGLGTFDVGTGNIPAGATVNSAKLVCYDDGSQSNSGGDASKVYRVKRTWTEAGVTWNKYDGTNNWQTAGAGGANDIDTTTPTPVAFTSFRTDAGVFEITGMVSFVTDAIANRSSIVNILIEMNDETNAGADRSYAWYSRDYAADATKRWYLEVDYTGTATPLIVSMI